MRSWDQYATALYLYLVSFIVLLVSAVAYFPSSVEESK